MFPPVIADRLIFRFKFWADDTVYKGMRHRFELYRHVASFSKTNRQQAYSLGTDLCQHNKPAVITSSESGYDVWVSLRSPLDPVQEVLVMSPETSASQSKKIHPDKNNSAVHPTTDVRPTAKGVHHSGATIPERALWHVHA